MVEIIKLDDGTYIPRECCTVTNPLTSGGKSEIDDIDMPCGADCDGECSECVVQKIMNEYAILTGQAENKLNQSYDNGYNKALDDAIQKFLQYGCVCVEWSKGLSKEKLVDDVLRQAMGQVVYTLEKMKCK